MDNLCHTLAAAACGEAGLKRLTPWAQAGLVISANMPDVDFIVLLGETPHAAYRRGLTHGVLAQAVLPVLVTAGLVAVDRAWARRTGRAPRVRPAAMLALTYVGMLSHVLLDYMNTYGIRLLHPFSGRWFHADALFIIDPWLWLVLGAGVALARRGGGRRPAAIALAISALYMAGMLGLSAAGRGVVEATWREAHGTPPQALLVGPTALHPFRHEIIVDAGDRYELGELRWWPRQARFDAESIPKNDQAPAVARAREHPHVRAVLGWARFPYYRVEPAGSGVRVTVEDARYGRWLGATTVTVEP